MNRRGESQRKRLEVIISVSEMILHLFLTVYPGKANDMGFVERAIERMRDLLHVSSIAASSGRSIAPLVKEAEVLFNNVVTLGVYCAAELAKTLPVEVEAS